MYIEEITLDGFKSYQKRMIVGPLSSEFNAITGLNGSGKSNILDSVCFVMGIKSLAQMRVSKMDELVYKQGQAGTTKASVTLLFNNENKNSSPPMYREKNRISLTRQIVVGGRDRYLLNGHNAKPADVHSLFLSVQLNVNNPHFLIMQGRITKVINMKPKDMLGLIEEAAGTRMYEAKRLESAKKISRKQTKLDEIEKVLSEEIEPALNSLRKERQDYQKWNSLNRQIEDLQRLSTTYSYYRDSKLLKDGKEQMELEEKKRKDLDEKMKSLRSETQRTTERLEQQQEMRLQSEQPLREMIASFKEKEKERMKAMTTRDEVKKELVKAEKALDNAKKASESIENELTVLKSDSSIEKQLKRENVLQGSVEKLRKELVEADSTLAALRTGQASSDGVTAAQSLRGELIEHKSNLTSLKGEETSLKVSNEKWKKELGQMQKKQSGENKETGGLKSELAYKVSQVDKISKELSNLEYNPQMTKNLKEEISNIDTELTTCGEKENQTFGVLKQALDVHRRFPSDEVMGPVFELFRVKHTHLNYCLALEECGKGKLFNVVVRDDGVAQQVLESSQKRMTCIPLNKIKAFDPPREKLQRARKLLGLAKSDNTSICLPIDIIEPTSDKYTDALHFTFGSSIICKTNDIAKKISHDPSIKALAITLNGDTYNPQGTVSGGSKAGLNKLLESFELYSSLRTTITDLTSKKRELEVRRDELQNSADAHYKLSGLLETVNIEIVGLQERLRQVESQSNATKIASLTVQIEEGEIKLKSLAAAITELQIQIPQLETEITEFNSNKAERTKILQNRISTARKELTKAEKELKTHQDSTDGDREKISVLTQQWEDALSGIGEKEVKLKQEEDRMGTIESKLAEHEKACEEVKVEIKKIESQMKDEMGQVNILAKEKEQTEQQAISIEALLKKLNHQFSNLKKSVTERDKRRQQLERQFPWLKHETHSSLTNDAFLSLDGRNVEDIQDEVTRLESEKLQLHKRINKKVINMLETAEKEFEDLRGKRQRVVQDKVSIEAFMRDLDEKKCQALDLCWQEVNGHFGGIFSTLLPGTNACLCELDDAQSFQDGLQMKVAFGGVWKNSLSELSGGQRSLLALSLVLALLKYKPAPLYILDEVDAALDLSHTQNIGQMINQHFRGSQFIIVSLKENLFNYADVLFRTSFVEGNSVVSRTENKTKDKKVADDKENEPVAGKRKRQGLK